MDRRDFLTSASAAIFAPALGSVYIDSAGPAPDEVFDYADVGETETFHPRMERVQHFVRCAVGDDELMLTYRVEFLGDGTRMRVFQYDFPIRLGSDGEVVRREPRIVRALGRWRG